MSEENEFYAWVASSLMGVEDIQVFQVNLEDFLVTHDLDGDEEEFKGQILEPEVDEQEDGNDESMDNEKKKIESEENGESVEESVNKEEVRANPNEEEKEDVVD